jgi:5-methyltetrahydropteroyltriglutamate--homocysteine methyltransferase
MLFPCQEIGSLKKPAWLLEYVKQNKISEEERERARRDAAYLNIKLLEDIGLDIVYDGEVRRVEMYEYPIRHISGFVFAGEVRSFDNRYYRKARCINRVMLREDYHLSEFLFVKEHARKHIKVPITGPYTLADWSYNEYYESKEELMIDLARNAVRPLIADLVNHDAKIIQIDEPAATTHPSEMRLVVDGINECVKGIDAKFIVHICYSGNEYRALIPYAMDIDVHQFALEFANRDTWSNGLDDDSRRGYRVLKEFKDYGYSKEIGLGVVDVHVNNIESPELVRDRILYAAKILGAEKIYVNPDCGLRTRSRDVAISKLKSMVQGAMLARSALEGR